MAPRLGDLLEVLHRGPALASFEAEGTWFRDTMAMMAFQRSSANRPMPGGTRIVQGTGMFVSDGSPSRQPGSATDGAENTFHAWFDDAEPSRWRVDRNTGTEVASGDDQIISWNASQAVTKPSDTASQRLPTQLPPLIDGYQLQSDFLIDDPLGEITHAGRPCWHFSAVERPTRSPGIQLMVSGFPAAELDVVVDQQTGFILRCSGTHQGQKVFAFDVTRFEHGHVIPDAIFNKQPPPDLAIIDEAELLRAAQEALPRVDPSPYFEATAADPPIDGHQDALIDIGITCEKMFTVSADGASMPYVSGGANLGPVSGQAKGQFGEPKSEVAGIKIIATDRAIALLRVSATNFPGGAQTSVEVEKVGDKWLVTRSEIAKLYGFAGVRLPEPPAE